MRRVVVLVALVLSVDDAVTLLALGAAVVLVAGVALAAALVALAAAAVSALAVLVTVGHVAIAALVTVGLLAIPGHACSRELASRTTIC